MITKKQLGSVGMAPPLLGRNVRHDVEKCCSADLWPWTRVMNLQPWNHTSQLIVFSQSKLTA